MFKNVNIVSVQKEYLYLLAISIHLIRIIGKLLFSIDLYLNKYYKFKDEKHLPIHILKTTYKTYLLNINYIT